MLRKVEARGAIATVERIRHTSDRQAALSPRLATPPLPASASALLHLRPAMATGKTMHLLTARTTPWVATHFPKDTLVLLETPEAFD